LVNEKEGSKMRIKRALSFALCLIIAVGMITPVLTVSADADEYDYYLNPYANPYAEVSHDGVANTVVVPIKFEDEPILSELPARLIDSTTFIPLAEFVREVIDEETEAEIELNDNTLTIELPGLHITATYRQIYIVANGRFLFAPAGCRMIDGEMFVPIRPVAQAFGFTVNWCSETSSVNLVSEYDFIKCGSEFYDEEDVYWLARIIRIESHHEPFLGKIGIGNVIMNRVNSSAFSANTVHGVIFDRTTAIQFPPAHTPAMTAHDPCPSCIAAAKLALEGASVVANALYFNERWINSWARRNRPFVTTIGNHSFFA
jgi:N-acetylmuramoyl-L-alanine amidase